MKDQNVLIFSQDFEPATCDVMDWIDWFGKTPFRINIDLDELDQIEYIISNDKCLANITIENKTLDLKETYSYWYRRGGLPVTKNWALDISKIFSKLFLPAIKNALAYEYSALRNFTYSILYQKKIKIGDPFKCAPNKLEVLDLAKEIGLKIPKTIVTNNKKDLLNFRKSNPDLITKNISGSPFIKNSVGQFYSYTERLSNRLLQLLPSHFFPSIVQEEVKKKYEIRTFYLNGQCSSMAIFSQADSQTAIDFRKYNTEKSNRTVPYKLPKIIESKIDLLMKKLELESGSIDIILSETNEYCFLEVNPVGQFGMVSSPCNYYLEKRIAKYLTGHDEQKN